MISQIEKTEFMYHSRQNICTVAKFVFPFFLTPPRKVHQNVAKKKQMLRKMSEFCEMLKNVRVFAKIVQKSRKITEIWNGAKENM